MIDKTMESVKLMFHFEKLDRIQIWLLPFSHIILPIDACISLINCYMTRFSDYRYNMDQLALSGMGKYGNVVLIRKAGGEGSKVPLFDKQSIFGRYINWLHK